MHKLRNSSQVSVVWSAASNNLPPHPPPDNKLRFVAGLYLPASFEMTTRALFGNRAVIPLGGGGQITVNWFTKYWYPDRLLSYLIFKKPELNIFRNIKGKTFFTYLPCSVNRLSSSFSASKKYWPCLINTRWRSAVGFISFNSSSILPVSFFLDFFTPLSRISQFGSHRTPEGLKRRQCGNSSV